MKRFGSLIVVCALAGCAPSEGGLNSRLPPEGLGGARPVDAERITDVLVQTVTPSVDILFMVDNSCSMGDDQDLLSANFPAFMNYFEGSGLEYHIGVVSSDMVNPAERGKLIYKGNNEVPWIRWEDANQILQFQRNSVLGNSGAAPERGTGAVFASKNDPQALVRNEGFFRDNSAIHCVAASDERDYSEPRGDIDQREFINWFDGLKRSAEERTFSSIENPQSIDYAGGGRFYGQVTRAIGGERYDARQQNWQPILDRLGFITSGRKSEFFLSQLPYDETIEVRLRTPLDDGQILDAVIERAFFNGNDLQDAEGEDLDSETPYWYFIGDRNAISFVNEPPGDLAQVEISYVPRSTGFGGGFEVDDGDESGSEASE